MEDREFIFSTNNVRIIGEFCTSIEESKLSSEERDKLDDEDFGIPELRKYPLNDKKHVEQAIKMFNHVDRKYEELLADNILTAMEKYKISTDSIGKSNKLRKYLDDEDISITEGLIWNDNTPKDIKELREKIKNEIKTLKTTNIADTVKDAIKNRDFTYEEKNMIFYKNAAMLLNI